MTTPTSRRTSPRTKLAGLPAAQGLHLQFEALQHRLRLQTQLGMVAAAGRTTHLLSMLDARLAAHRRTTAR